MIKPKENKCFEELWKIKILRNIIAIENDSPTR